MESELADFVGTRQHIQIRRSFSANESFSGYLLALSDSLGLMHIFHDFSPDGYIVFRTRDVLDVRSNESDDFFHRIIKAEGLQSGLDLRLHVDLKSMRTAITSIHAQFGRLIVECERKKPEDDEFYIGQLSAVSTTKIYMNEFDAAGVWCEEPAEISIRNITLVQFESPYLQMFWKYVPPFEEE